MQEQDHGTTDDVIDFEAPTQEPVADAGENNQPDAPETEAGEVKPTPGVDDDLLEDVEALTPKQLTLQYAMMKLQIERLTKSLNSMINYVNNLQENPAFVAGLLGHINELVAGEQVFFIQVHPVLSEEDQKKTYRCTLYVNDQVTTEENELEQPKVEVSMEVFDKQLNEWACIIDDDPIQLQLRESILARLVLIGAVHGQPMFVTICPVDYTAPAEPT